MFSFGNKNPASGYKLQIFDKGQIMKGSSGNITAVNLHGIEDATGAISPNLVGVHSISRKKVS